jgi:hypothetical protein
VRALRVAAAVLALGTVGGGCADAGSAMPRCSSDRRLAIVAQSVPGAVYLPCVSDLPPGWRVTHFEVDDDGTRFELRSDRSDQPVEVSLTEECSLGRATPITPRADGVRSYLRVESISPRYAGRFRDVFSGGCITTEFDFARGAHVVLVDELRQLVGLTSRRQVSQELEHDLGVRLDP